MPNTAAAEIPPPQAEEVEPAAEAPTPPAGRDARNWRKNHRPRLAETPAEAPALEMTDAG
jgi:hypothetical protein